MPLYMNHECFRHNFQEKISCFSEPKNIPIQICCILRIFMKARSLTEVRKTGIINSNQIYWKVFKRTKVRKIFGVILML